MPLEGGCAKLCGNGEGGCSGGVVSVAVVAAVLAVSCLHRARCSQGDALCLVLCCDFPGLLSASAREKSECDICWGPVCRWNIVRFEVFFLLGKERERDCFCHLCHILLRKGLLQVCVCVYVYSKIIRLSQSKLFLSACSWVFLDLELCIFVVLLVALLYNFLAPQMQNCHWTDFFVHVF